MSDSILSITSVALILERLRILLTQPEDTPDNPVMLFQTLSAPSEGYSHHVKRSS